MLLFCITLCNYRRLCNRRWHWWFHCATKFIKQNAKMPCVSLNVREKRYWVIKPVFLSSFAARMCVFSPRTASTIYHSYMMWSKMSWPWKYPTSFQYAEVQSVRHNCIHTKSYIYNCMCKRVRAHIVAVKIFHHHS